MARWKKKKKKIEVRGPHNSEQQKMSAENRKLHVTYLCPTLLRIPQERAINPDNCCFYDGRGDWVNQLPMQLPSTAGWPFNWPRRSRSGVMDIYYELKHEELYGMLNPECEEWE